MLLLLAWENFMVRSILILLLANMTLGLVITITGIKELSLSLNQVGFNAIISSMNFDHVNLPLLLKILKNDWINLMPTYMIFCQRWPWPKFKLVADWASQLQTSHDRDIILNHGCIRRLPYADRARHYLLSIGLPNGVTDYESIITLENWTQALTLLNPSWQLRGWCSVIPFDYLTQSFLSKVDLAAMMDRSCLQSNYPSKTLLLTALSNQLRSSSKGGESISRLLLNIYGIKDPKVSEIRRSLYKVICERKIHHKTITPSLFDANRTFFCRQPATTTNTTHYLTDQNQLFSQLILGSSTSPSISILLIRMWIKIAPIDIIRQNLPTAAPKKFTLAPFDDIVLLASDLFRKNSIASSAKLLKMFSKDLDTLLLSLPRAIWAINPNKLIQQPISWRLKYYRRWNMGPALFEVDQGSSPPSSSLFKNIVPRHYLQDLNITYEMFRSRAENIVLRDRLYAQNPYYSHDGLKSVRPRIWLAKSEFSNLLNFIIYSIVRYGKPAVLLCKNYCKLIKYGIPDDFSRYALDDLEDFGGVPPTFSKFAPYRVDLETLSSIKRLSRQPVSLRALFSSITQDRKASIDYSWSVWGLHVIFPDTNPCDILS